jgi:hypothetical protein
MAGNQDPACSPRHAVLADYIGSGRQFERVSEDRTPEDGKADCRNSHAGHLSRQLAFRGPILPGLSARKLLRAWKMKPENA